jgi:hypothetical protein
MKGECKAIVRLVQERWGMFEACYSFTFAVPLLPLSLSFTAPAQPTSTTAPHDAFDVLHRRERQACLHAQGTSSVVIRCSCTNNNNNKCNVERHVGLMLTVV